MWKHAQSPLHIRQHSREAYAEPWQPKVEDGETSGDDAPEPPEENNDDDPLKPSQEL